MTNSEFIKKYGVLEMRDLLDSIYDKLSILRLKRKIGRFKISKRKMLIYLYKDKLVRQYEVASLYSLTDKELVRVLNFND